MMVVKTTKILWIILTIILMYFMDNISVLTMIKFNILIQYNIFHTSVSMITKYVEVYVINYLNLVKKKTFFGSNR